jgi:hypothetical protein
MDVTRRQFLEASGVVAAGALVKSPFETQRSAAAKAKRLRTIYRLSAGGRRISNAAKNHNANMRFATMQAADTNRAHKGDHSRIVPLTVTVQEHTRLFPGRAVVVDLRHLRHPPRPRQR